MANNWANGFCDCFGDCTTCELIDHHDVGRNLAIYTFLLGIITYFCPCYVFGKNAEQLGESCLMYCLSQFVPVLDIFCRTIVRGKIRDQRGIDGSILMDFLMHWICPICALVQEARVSNDDVYVYDCLRHSSWRGIAFCKVSHQFANRIFLLGIESCYRPGHGQRIRADILICVYTLLTIAIYVMWLYQWIILVCVLCCPRVRPHPYHACVIDSGAAHGYLSPHPSTALSSDFCFWLELLLCLDSSFANSSSMSNDWTNGLCDCFSDCTTCKCQNRCCKNCC